MKETKVSLTFEGPDEDIDGIVQHMSKHFGLTLEDWELPNVHITGTEVLEVSSNGH